MIIILTIFIPFIHPIHIPRSQTIFNNLFTYIQIRRRLGFVFYISLPVFFLEEHVFYLQCLG